MRTPLTAGELWLWLDMVVREYGSDLPLYVAYNGMPVQLGDAKLKTNGKDTHIVVFLPVKDDV